MGLVAFGSRWRRLLTTTGTTAEVAATSGMGLGLKRRSRLAFATTDSDDIAIAAAAMIGLKVSPNAGYSAPAAIGMPRLLYRKAKTRFCRMFRMVARERSTAVTTPDSAPEIKVMSEDSIATSVPVPIADPTSA